MKELSSFFHAEGLQNIPQEWQRERQPNPGCKYYFLESQAFLGIRF